MFLFHLFELILWLEVDLVGSFPLFNNFIYAQRQEIDEFLEWPSTDNYNYVIIVIIILISLGVIANYLWSNRKGRRYSAE